MIPGRAARRGPGSLCCVLLDVSRPLASPSQGRAFTAPALLLSEGECLVAHGVETRVAAPPASLAAAAAAALRERGPRVLIGAMPFDTTRAAHLVVPERVERLPLWSLGAASPAGGQRVRAIRSTPDADGYRAGVATALRRIAAGDLRKVVLSRRLTIDFDAPVDPVAVVMHLRRDPRVTTFCVPLPGAVPTWLVGATPELLLAKRGSGIQSAPLAGSARRQADPAADRAAGEALAASEKDRREHAAVVESIADRLSPYCRTLQVPATPSLTATATMWHLGTSISGELKDPRTSSIVLAAALHPTPAVCGVPHDAARACIARLEPFDRGFFSGAVGWTGGDGDGRWLVAIRCAQVSGATAELFAGAGIVNGSTPDAELDETAAKFETLLRALGVDSPDHLGARP
jgi:isochorismate synthase